MGFTPANTSLLEGPGDAYFFENGIHSGPFAPPSLHACELRNLPSGLVLPLDLALFPGRVKSWPDSLIRCLSTLLVVRYLDRDDGQTVAGFQFGGLKVSLVSDVDVVCNQAPLEIGNRVWCDGNSGTAAANNNGVQDPGEPGVSGATVTLDCVGDTPVTVNTSANGDYLFTDAIYQASSNASSIPRDGSCSVSVNLVSQASLFAAVCGTSMATTLDAGGAGPGADLRDSDAADLGGGLAGANITTGEAGENDHTVDIGIRYAPPVSDYGDAPASYSTLTGAGHVLPMSATLYLGACVDAEAAGQPSAAFGDPADGDDANDLGTALSVAGTCTGGDDEDGVTFTSMIAACGTATVSVASQGTGGVLNAWLDFNADGDFLDTGEQIFMNQALTGGGATDALNFTVPCAAESGNTYARFRVATASGLTSVSLASDGEVEDYMVVSKGRDFGDAPASYATAGAGAASHAVDPATALYLGACVDTEADGQPVAAESPATGDDLSAGLSNLGTCVGNDDEDGVTFDDMLIACGTSNLTVTSSLAGRLDAWIDFNGDGDFGDAGEQIYTSQAVAAGANSLSYSVSCSAETDAVTYARFRVSTSGGLGSAGPAMDGEVEDYEVTTKGLDFGDAPDTYLTDGTGAASHVVDPATPLYLGACVDTEGDGQAVIAGAPATGDDLGVGLSTLGTCAQADDEDGVSFDDMLVACGTSNLTATASQAGLLDAWVDFNGDGDFGDAGEQIFSSEAVAAGANALSYSVPCSTESASVTYARFRVSTAGGLSAAGQAMDGEVEDYDVTTKGLDLGDAPDTYLTSSGAGGASHAVDPASPLYLGACVDTEADGQPVAAGSPATGDDLGAGLSSLGTCSGNDDEDGVTFDDMLVACGASNLTVTASQVGMLDAWVDFNGDGDFADAGEQVLASQTIAAGANAVTYSVPCSAESVEVTYARFRVSTAGGLASSGPAMDGEVEDYEVTTKGLDFGDAPDTYLTTVGSGGASHAVDPATPLYLGACVDTEINGQPSVAKDPATGDDIGAGLSSLGTCAGNDDEDGVSFDDMLVACGTSNLTATASMAGLLDAWVDFNDDGDFSDAGEQILTSQPVAAGSNSLSYSVPCAAETDTVTYARFRVSTAGGLSSGGSAMDGEVEDYEVTTKGLDFGDAPDTYGTTNGVDGASHVVNPDAPFYLGACVDTETDGQPVVAGSPADGDNLGAGNSALGTCTGAGDEDGVTFPDGMAMGAACEMTSLTVDLVNPDGVTPALLHAWIDFNNNGSFEASELITAAAGQGLTAGSNTVTYDVPCDAVAANPTYARFRLSSSAATGPTGLVMAGEVEDYAFQVKPIDCGDSPDAGLGGADYCTNDGNEPAWHVLLDDGPTLGSTVDQDICMEADPMALGDLDDGVVLVDGEIVINQEACLMVDGGTTGGQLDAWIDWLEDGEYGSEEDNLFYLVNGVAGSFTLTPGANEICFDAPPSLSDVLNARFRISTAGGLDACGGALDGEVEDYQFEGINSVLAIPTMSEWGFGLLILLLAAVGVRRMSM